MKKLVLYVEGHTESLFVENLIRLMVNGMKIRIARYKATGGRKKPRRIELISQMPPLPEQEYLIQIVESRGDERVGTDVRDNYEKLVQKGFSSIIAIRDVYPRHHFTNLSTLRRDLRYRLKTKPINPVFVLGVMEIEAWFLAEHTHFPKIHPNLTVERIKAAFRFDPSLDDMQARPCPHEDLHRIYQLEGLAYEKSTRKVQRTVGHLDYGIIYLELIEKFPDLKTLMESLDSFFT